MLKNNDISARDKMTEDICRYRFAVLETALYLDTHPNDAYVLKRHNEFVEMLEDSIASFNRAFGEPLTLYEKTDDWYLYIENWPVGQKCRCGGQC